jgi:hypothetical protein
VNEDLQRTAIALAMMMLSYTQDGIFGFSLNDFRKIAATSPEMINLHMGSFGNKDDQTIIVWRGERSRDEIQAWLDNTPTTEIEMAVPVANPDVSIN